MGNGSYLAAISFGILNHECSYEFSTSARFSIGARSDNKEIVKVGIKNRTDDSWAVHQLKTTANFASKSKIVAFFLWRFKYASIAPSISKNLSYSLFTTF